MGYEYYFFILAKNYYSALQFTVLPDSVHKSALT